MPPLLDIRGALIDRKNHSLSIKTDALRNELVQWRKISSDGQQLEKHKSQVSRIATRMEGLLERIQKSSTDPAQVLNGERTVEQKLLTAHTIWDFFRAKFAQRLDMSYAMHLRICDEFAWHCYAPVQKMFHTNPENAKFVASTREPPLVFLNSGWSPLARGRRTAFQVDQASGGWAAHQDFLDVIEDLPVPLIGLPWFHVAHLPDVLVVAHEVGHLVEWDFQLRPDLRAALAAAVPPLRLSAWEAWLSEVFADIFGCLAGRAAFVATLLDFLVQSVERLNVDRRNAGVWGDYPPAWLRTSVLIETLRKLATDDKEREMINMLALRQETYFGQPQTNRDFIGDAEVVASAILDCTCSTLSTDNGAAPLVRDLLNGPTPNPWFIAQNIAKGNSSKGADLTALVAAARWTWEQNPAFYTEERLDIKIRTMIPPPNAGPRGRRRGIGMTDEMSQERQDKERGELLFDSLFPATQ